MNILLPNGSSMFIKTENIIENLKIIICFKMFNIFNFHNFLFLDRYFLLLSPPSVQLVLEEKQLFLHYPVIKVTSCLLCLVYFLNMSYVSHDNMYFLASVCYFVFLSVVCGHFQICISCMSIRVVKKTSVF